MQWFKAESEMRERERENNHVYNIHELSSAKCSLNKVTEQAPQISQQN